MFNFPMANVGQSEFKMAVALGLVPGWRSFRKFGTNPAVVSGTQELWPEGTPRVLPTSSTSVTAVSTSAEDTMTTGTGAWSIRVEGLDVNGNEVSQDFEMKGITLSLSADQFYRVNRAYVLESGSNGTNVGSISIDTFPSNNTQAVIIPGSGQTLQTQYTVPAGHTVLVDHYTIGTGRSAGNNDTHIASQIMLPGGSWRTQSDIYLWEASYTEQSPIYVLPENTEVKQIVVSTTTGQANSIWSGYIVDNNYLPDGWLNP